MTDEWILREAITKVIHDMGIPAHIKGYQYLREAIVMSVNDITVLNRVTYNLYPVIAEKYGTSRTAVERAMRTAIETGWSRGNINKFHKMFGYSVNSDKGRPTNSEFIALIADEIRLKYRN